MYRESLNENGGIMLYKGKKKAKNGHFYHHVEFLSDDVIARYSPPCSN
jgi:hypothetical protein